MRKQVDRKWVARRRDHKPDIFEDLPFSSADIAPRVFGKNLVRRALFEASVEQLLCGELM